MSKISLVFPVITLLNGCGSWMELREVDPGEKLVMEFCKNHAEKHYPSDYRLREETEYVKVTRMEPGFVECTTTPAGPSIPSPPGMNLPDTRINKTTCSQQERSVESYDTVTKQYLWDVNWSAWGSDYLACMRAKGYPQKTGFFHSPLPTTRERRKELSWFDNDWSYPSSGSLSMPEGDTIYYSNEWENETNQIIGRKMVREAQEKLTSLGYSPGPADGLFGAKTREAVKQFQKRSGLIPSGKLDDTTMARLSEKKASKKGPYSTKIKE